MARIDLLTPVGRLVAGSLYKGNTTDAEGKPLVVKSGPNMGQPRVEFYFALAIPKGAEQSWAQTEWGAKIHNQGLAAFPAQAQSPQFAWKVKDGDSTIPNRKGKRPVDQIGHPGHWVLSFSSGYAPKITRDDGSVPVLEADAVKLGDYVQVFGSVDGNGSSSQPGVYLNHSMVNLAGYGKRIVVGPDAASVGFGQGVQLPAGASMVPQGDMVPPAAAGVPLPGMPATPPAGIPMPGVAAAAPLPVAPNPGIMPTAPAIPVAPPAAPVRQMTAKAAGATYESFISQGWNDALLVQHGYMNG